MQQISRDEQERPQLDCSRAGAALLQPTAAHRVDALCREIHVHDVLVARPCEALVQRGRAHAHVQNAIRLADVAVEEWCQSWVASVPVSYTHLTLPTILLV